MRPYVPMGMVRPPTHTQGEACGSDLMGKVGAVAQPPRPGMYMPPPQQPSFLSVRLRTQRARAAPKVSLTLRPTQPGRPDNPPRPPYPYL
jgi:hypothetical protein